MLADISADAEAVNTSNELNSLRDRIDSLELLVEEFGQARELQDAIRSYVTDLKEELADLRNYRFWVTAISVSMAATLFGLLVGCMIAKPKWFLDLDGALQVPLIVALGGGAVFLMSLCLRGVYRSRHERNQGEMLPEIIKVGREAMKID